jgi:hypothetical protein
MSLRKSKILALMDNLYFDDASKLSISSHGSTVQYPYEIIDSALCYGVDEASKKLNKYRIKVSTKDSLVLKRTETWGKESPVKITVIYHLVAIDK